MRKLSKIINKRRLKYKPTIGVEFGKGNRLSANLYEWKKYLQEKEAAEEAAARAVAKKFLWDFLEEKCPDLVRAIGVLSDLGYMYY